MTLRRKPNDPPKRSDDDTGARGAATLRHNPFASLAKSQALGELRARQSPAPAPSQKAEPARPEQDTYRPSMLRLRLESRGRSGKVVTRLAGLPRSNVGAIASRLRKALGCSAIVEDSDVLLEGSLLERASRWLESAGDLRDIRDDPPRQQSPSLETLAPAPVPELDAAASGAGTKRSNIRRGARVAIVLKADQGTGKLTEGVVRDILTSSPVHPRGIKVRLETGEVGRVKLIR